MFQVRCVSCGAHFLPRAMPALSAEFCSRCGFMLSGPARPVPGYRQPVLMSVDFLSPATCVSCSCVLSFHERTAGDICGFPGCRMRRAAQTIVEKEKARREEVLGLLGELGLPGTAEPLLAVTPLNDRRLGPTDPARVATFEANTRRLLEGVQAAEAEQELRVDLPPSEELAGARLGQACGLCRGSCCQSGKEHAYLSSGTLSRVWGHAPEQTADELIASYLAHIPAEVYEDACVFQSATGCGLPRRMRSTICNEFLCRGLRNALGAAGDPAVPHLVVAAMLGPRIVRLALVDGATVTMVRDEPLDATPTSAS